jgi:hypothetical protein
MRPARLGPQLARYLGSWLVVLAVAGTGGATETAGLPDSESYTRQSLPAAIAKAIRTATDAEALYGVRRFRGEAEAVWVVRPPCREPEKGCAQLIFLERGQAVRQVGHTKGDLIDADVEHGLPSTLYFHVRGTLDEARLQWKDDGYRTKVVARRYRDPLTHERVTAEALRAATLDDLQQGRFISSAGRGSLLCEDSCTALDVETIATASLEARLFPQAEAALRRATALKGHQAQDWASLASLYRAQGRNTEAEEAEARYQAEHAAEPRGAPPAAGGRDGGGN